MDMDRSRTPLLSLAAAPLALGLSLSSLATPARAQEPEPHPILGDPLVIDGDVVPFERIQRAIVYGPLGVEPLRLAKLRVFIEEEMERQIEAGADPESFVISQEVIDDAIQKAEEQVGVLYEGQDIELETFYPTKDEAWLDNVRVTQLFNRVFLPDNPHEYPPITIEALQTSQGQANLYDHLVQQWDQEQAGSIEEDPMGKAMIAMVINQTVIKHLEKTADVVEDPDELPEGVAMRVNGVDITIDRIWQGIDDLVTPNEVEMAKRWIVNTMLLEENLKSTGHWIDDETAERLYAEYSAPYADSPFSVEAVAKRFQKFPTISAYKTYFRIQESMKRRLRDNMRDLIVRKRGENIRKEAAEKAKRILEEPERAEQTADPGQSVEGLADEIYEELVEEYTDQRYDEALARLSATRTSRLAGDARVQVDIILVSAYDFAHKRWKEDGWEKAEERTRQLVSELAGELKWKDAVEEYSDFYDPPLPTGQMPNYVPNNKGRFRAIARNDLMKRLDESVFSSFLTGGSITDYIFFDMPTGRMENPMKGPYGYYIARLYSRGGPKRWLDFENPDHRDLIEQDFVQVRTLEMIDQLVAQNEIQGI